MKNNIEIIRKAILDQFKGDEKMADIIINNNCFADLEDLLRVLEYQPTFHIDLVREMETIIKTHKGQGDVLCFDLEDLNCSCMDDSCFFMDATTECLNFDDWLPRSIYHLDYWWNTYFVPELYEMVKRQGVTIKNDLTEYTRIYIAI